MYGDIQGYMKSKYGGLPTRQVTESECIRLMMALGSTEEDAKFQADISKKMGSSVRVGEEFLEIVDEQKSD